jgi:hypothetical protein
LLSLVGLVAVMPGCHTSTESLIGRFGQYQPQIEELKKMVDQERPELTFLSPDRVIGPSTIEIANSDRLSEAGLSPDRFSQYMTLFRTVGIKSLIRSRQSGCIYLVVQAGALTNGDESAGFLFSPRIDAGQPCEAEAKATRHALKPHWYMFRYFN